MTESISEKMTISNSVFISWIYSVLPFVYRLLFGCESLAKAHDNPFYPHGRLSTHGKHQTTNTMWFVDFKQIFGLNYDWTTNLNPFWALKMYLKSEEYCDFFIGSIYLTRLPHIKCKGWVTCFQVSLYLLHLGSIATPFSIFKWCSYWPDMH